jgi:hypothetical protein
MRRTNKRPSPPGEGPFGLRWLVALATVPPRSSVLPPGAGNELKEPIKAEKRAKQREEGYVGEPGRLDRHMDAAAIRRGDDGDRSAVLAIELAQMSLQRDDPPERSRAVRAV